MSAPTPAPRKKPVPLPRRLAPARPRSASLLASTRQSVRRLARRFHSSGSPETGSSGSTEAPADDDLDVFSAIRFESPISFGPPAYAAPQLPGEYDAPAHAATGYDTVFPAESSASSWRFYDSVGGRVENIYSDIDDGGEGDGGREANEGMSEFSVEIRNSAYENHEIVQRNERGKASRSVMILFDPLINDSSDPPTPPNCDNVRMLEDFFDRSLYHNNMASIQTLDDWSVSNESGSDEILTPPPPPPPVRFDSLPVDEEAAIEPSAPPPTPAAAATGRFSWLRQVRNVLERPTVAAAKGGGVTRPVIDARHLVNKKGMLFRVQSGPIEELLGEYSGRWCHLQNAELVCYADNTAEVVRERFLAESIMSIQVIQDPNFKYKHENEDLHCFELNTTNRSRNGHVYGTRDLPERRIWMQYLCEMLCKKFGTQLSTNYTRMGWAFLREGVTGKWMGAWILLSKRKLYYIFDDQPYKSIDLRKARCIVLQVYNELDANPKTNDKGTNIVLDTPNLAIYLRMWTARETKVWCHIIKLAAHNNGANIEEQQLTKNNIPVLVEKCINFIYTHGSMSQGIYRKQGTNKSITDILVRFRKNAWDVQLSKDQYSEHDVATALKRFFRDLPEPLLPGNKRQYLHSVSLLKNKDEQIRMYKAALDELTPITYTTARKLFGHLHFIASQHKTNLMNGDNLSIIWAVPLMTSSNDEMVNSNRQINDSTVVKHLIEMYKFIFPEDAAEIQHEKIMLQALKKYAQSPQGSVKNNATAGDLRVWIHVNEKGETFNVAVGATKTAYEVCVELSGKIGLPVSDIILEEVVLNDKLRRPIHHTEKVLDIVLNWGYWDENDRKDNYLILIPILKYFEIVDTKSDLIWDDFKFADVKTKSFKSYTFKIAQKKLSYYKDRTTDVPLNSWNLNDIIWYVGHESKRSAPSRWAVTFIEKKFHPKRTKATPFFGNAIVCSSEQERAYLLLALIKCLHPDGLHPPAMHVNLMN